MRARRALVAVVLAWSAACLDSDVVRCADGAVCASGTSCLAEGGGCLDPRYCADLPDGTSCVAAATPDGACHGGRCEPVVCGDAFVDPGEACDDGDALAHDGCGGCALEEPRWRQATTLASPSGRRGHAMAYDPTRARIVLFGGTVLGSDRLGDTWEWDGAGWTEVTPAGGSPAGRAFHSLAFDPIGARVLLFGGYLDSDPPASDTWAWDGTSWSEVSPAGAGPSARYGQTMVQDAGGAGVLLVGGYDDAGGGKDDTWSWDGLGWTEVGGRGPGPAGSLQAAALDAVRDRVIVYGGLGLANEAVDDVWSWDGTAWSRAPMADTPGPRQHHAAAFDVHRAAFTFTGGLDDDSLRQRSTWSWDGGGWTNVSAVGAPPRSEHAMAYDAARSQIVLFGGTGGGAPIADTWVFRFDGPSPVEDCPTGGDADGDGLAGCDDPDCWARCSPLCPPGAASCDADAPRCGDGGCNAWLESCGLCPDDCGACP